MHSAMAQDACSNGAGWPRMHVGATISHRGRTKQTMEVIKVTRNQLLNLQRKSETLGDPLTPSGNSLASAIEAAPSHSHHTLRMGSGLRNSFQRDPTPGRHASGRVWKGEVCGPASRCRPLRVGYCCIQV